MSYREYFDIDPEYFPQVDKKIIEEHPDLWKKFYPHPSFVQLLKSTVAVLERKQKLSIWVDGAYGTGKSHAVLTLKKLIEASCDDINEYFERYEQLDNYLCQKLIAQKNDGKILVCHRYGSSDIQSDTDLVIAIQEAIEKALVEAEIENNASTSLRNSLIRYFEDEENKQSFDVYARGNYHNILNGDTSDSILEKLTNSKEEALNALIEKVFKVPVIKGSFAMTTEELCDWIREIIEKNNLKELVFIWDEFSEYFENNMNHLTGFQQVAELSATAPFCLLIVTHKAEGYFSDGDPDKRKILDRFVSPIHISLPENIAFELMHEALKITDDIEKLAKWEKHIKSLENRTMQSRLVVSKKIGLTDQDLNNVLPIHPYAALLLQHISIYYTSTARSMFNFIKNDEGEDVKAFQWFIDRYDFSSPNPFVSIDMLWNFFYETGSQKLANGIREVLGCYTSKMDKELIEDEKRVLKTILLLQAISDRMSGNRDIFLPNNKNLTLAFEGTDLELSAENFAKKLLNDHVVTRTPLTGDDFSYCCKNIGPSVDSGPFIAEAKGRSTKDMSLMEGSNLRKTIEFTGALKLRYSLTYATLSDFDNEIKKADNPGINNNKLYAVATIGRDLTEGVALKKKIENFFTDHPESNAIVIDSSSCVLGEDEYIEFVENYAMSRAIGSSDLDQRKTYERYAIEVLSDWAKRIKSGDFYVYSRYATKGHRVVNAQELFGYLLDIDKIHYPKCIEATYTSVLSTMYDANLLKNGALCGINEETKGTFRTANEATKLENALKDAWQIPNYWNNSHSYIADLKKAIDEFISKAFNKSDRVSIASIYEMLKAEPYGFMPCNLTAFIIGFILKEYTTGVYSYSDNLTTVPLDAEKLASMIDEIIKQENTLDKRYKDKFIVTLTDEERAFNKATSVAFNIPEIYCVSVTETRSRIREQMKGFAFPIWTIKYVIDNKSFKTDKDVVSKLIDNYCGVANDKNMEGKMSYNDIALDIGKLCLQHDGAIDDLKSILTKDNCKAGMLEYLKVYDGGKLPSVAEKVNDNGHYINQLQQKFSSDAANWVWNKDTVNTIIDELICEYEIIEISSSILSKNNTYIDTIKAWCDKINQIRLAYSVIKNELGDSKDFYEMLYNLYRDGNLSSSQKKSFLDLLRQNMADFKSFMSSQSDLFFKACGYYLDELSEEDVKLILDDDAYGFAGSYVLERDKYTDKVQKAVDLYKNSQKYTQLKKKWIDLTGTDSPYMWSNNYNMPILAMIPNAEGSTARKVFETINSATKDESTITTALDYLDKITYAQQLNNSDDRDMAFREAFLGEYSELFDDVDEVRQYLKSHTTDSPYHWLGNKEVMAKIKDMANAKYSESGYGKAKKIIDEMPPEEVKEYLKKMIEDNVAVGLEIIKTQK